ncbi:uncharacterized protein LOC111712365 [Eurytemora carolleeae]|uniref:uncharacterized protein LOC111712365 n=1 Tax=Eurytemora carolleeae TaxID=1294199 RepID=UPI000C76E802|nr:uncharacterized protein LOC111712365 [Eurytemora carolleeae]|eukprot:XP_023342717.1 uncharacterized protein LOC111712365 [Eurytemora affinis]
MQILAFILFISFIQTGLGIAGISVSSCLGRGERCSPPFPSMRISNQCCQHQNLICLEDPTIPPPVLGAAEAIPRTPFLNPLEVSIASVLSVENNNAEQDRVYQLGVEAYNSQARICTPALP